MTISILLLGETGSGKSQLGNFLLKNPNAFYATNDPDSCTKDIQESYDINKKLLVIDTPGFEDSQGNDQKNIDKIVAYIRKKNINAIIILFNFHQTRLSYYIKEILIDIFKIFPQKNFFEHVGFVFSRSYSYYLQQNKEEKKKKFDFINNDVINLLLKAKKEIPSINVIENKKFPVFFIDSNLKKIDINSSEEVNRLIAWASSLSSLENSEIKNVTLKVIRRVPEYRKIKLDSRFYKNIEYGSNNELIREKIENYLKTVEKIKIICFVINGNTTRLIEEIKNIFSTVLSIFGNDVKNNFIFLFTYYDNANPPFLKVIRDDKESIFSNIIPKLQTLIFFQV